jgi:hypothetical protein
MSQPLKDFLNLSHPPFLHLSEDERVNALDRIAREHPDCLQVVQQKPSLGCAITIFAARHSLKQLSVPQLCDYHITAWALSGHDEHVQYILDIADGLTPVEHVAFRMSAEFAIQSISQQSDPFKQTVDRLRAARVGV